LLCKPDSYIRKPIVSLSGTTREGTEGNGTEDSKRRRGDRGEQTHAKPPPAAPGDLEPGDRDPPSPLRKWGEYQIVAGASGGRGRGQLKIQLMIQWVQDVRGGECIVLWDSEPRCCW
jgi:hypothetical protein